MNCPQCRSEDVRRVARDNIVRQVMHCLGGWPYLCRVCSATFYSSWRQPPPEPPSQPMARIVVRASSHAGLDRILLALNDALVKEGVGEQVSVKEVKFEVQ